MSADVAPSIGNRVKESVRCGDSGRNPEETRDSGREAAADGFIVMHGELKKDKTRKGPEQAESYTLNRAGKS